MIILKSVKLFLFFLCITALRNASAGYGKNENHNSPSVKYHDPSNGKTKKNDSLPIKYHDASSDPLANEEENAFTLKQQLIICKERVGKVYRPDNSSFGNYIDSFFNKKFREVKKITEEAGMYSFALMNSAKFYNEDLLPSVEEFCKSIEEPQQVIIKHCYSILDFINITKNMNGREALNHLYASYVNETFNIDDFFSTSVTSNQKISKKSKRKHNEVEENQLHSGDSEINDSKHSKKSKKKTDKTEEKQKRHKKDEEKDEGKYKEKKKPKKESDPEEIDKMYGNKFQRKIFLILQKFIAVYVKKVTSDLIEDSLLSVHAYCSNKVGIQIGEEELQSVYQ